MSRIPSKKIDVLGVIPARYASTRLPGKPLVEILGQTMIERVYRAAKAAIKNVVVATDDVRIVKAVREFGGEAEMTPSTCASGTERMAAVAKKIKARYYVNIQGDEPLMHPHTIKTTVSLALRKKSIATAATTLALADRNNPSAVKVVIGDDGRALYFSRSMIPFAAHGVSDDYVSLKHLGLYVYPEAALHHFVRLKATALEQTEKLEQLRALYHGMPIFVQLTEYDSIGVDTPADVDVVINRLREKNLN